ncbi:FMN-binding protein [Euzebyella marina]|nr:FMN-binding protein [Euzebyella marina]
MSKGNRKGYCVAIFLGLFMASFTMPQQSSKLQEKIDNAIVTTYGVEDFSLEPIIIPEEMNQATKAEFSGEHFYEIVNSNGVLGYAYVGTAASMKKEFEYILMFNTDLSIKKSKVLIYRENYGRQIGSQRWLKQFIGLTPNDELTYGKNIDAIAGATISASSMTRATDEILQSIKTLKEQNIIPLK